MQPRPGPGRRGGEESKQGKAHAPGRDGKAVPGCRVRAGVGARDPPLCVRCRTDCRISAGGGAEEPSHAVTGGDRQAHASKRKHRELLAGEVMPTEAAGGHCGEIDKSTPQADGWIETTVKRKKQKGDSCPKQRRPVRLCTCVCHQCQLIQCAGHRHEECSLCRSHPRDSFNQTHATTARRRGRRTARREPALLQRRGV